MTVYADVLFQPLQIKSMTVKNRVVMAPMTRSFAMGGYVDKPHVDYYRRRAEGGVGLLVTEGVLVDRAASHYEPNVPQFYGDKLDGWREVVDDAHKAGGAIAPQLWHTGACKSMTVDWEPDRRWKARPACMRQVRNAAWRCRKKRSRTPWMRSLALR